MTFEETTECTTSPRYREAPERQVDIHHCGAEPSPVVAGTSLSLAPRRQVIRCHNSLETCAFSRLNVIKELAWGELFVRGVVAN